MFVLSPPSGIIVTIFAMMAVLLLAAIGVLILEAVRRHNDRKYRLEQIRKAIADQNYVVAPKCDDADHAPVESKRAGHC